MTSRVSMLRFCLVVLMLHVTDAFWPFFDPPLHEKDCVMDLAFLIDDSSTIATFANGTHDEAKWNIIITFLQTLVRELNVGPSSTRVAAVSFGLTTWIAFDLTELKTKEEVVAEISNIPYRGETSRKNPALGLSEIRKLFDHADGDRPDIPNVVVIITDHVNDTNIAGLMNETYILKEMGTSIICIEFKPRGTSDTVMRRVVTTPPSIYYYAMSSVKELTYYTHNVDFIAKTTCEAARNPRDGCPMDLALLIDRSTSIASAANGRFSFVKWNLILDFFRSVSDSLDVRPSATHVAAITFEKRNATNHFMLNEGQIKSNVLTAIGDIQHMGDSEGRFPWMALHSARYEVFSEKNGDRSSMPNVVVMISGEVSKEDMEDVMLIAEDMKYLGTSIIWIVISNSINDTAMKMVVTTPSSENFIKVSSVESLKYFVDNTAIATCRAARKRQTGCVMDLAFLIDYSRSIAAEINGIYSAESWNDMLHFLQELLEDLEVGPSATHVASYTFANRSGLLHFDLNHGQTKDQVISDIGNIKSDESGDRAGRNPARALSVAKYRIFNSTHGDRSGVPNVIVIITAEVSNEDMADAMSKAEKLKYLGTSIIWLGVSRAINATAMKMVVNEPPSENFFAIPRLDSIHFFSEIISVAACRAAKNQQNACVMDLAFLIDHSSSIASDVNGIYSAEKWNLILNFFQNVVDNLDVGPSATHVASYTFGKQKAFYNFGFNRYQTKDNVVKAIGQIIHRGDRNGSNPVIGLNAMRSRVFNPSYGDRSGKPNVIVLLTEEVSNDDMREVMSKAEMMKYLGTSLIWIAVSNATNATAMKMTVSRPPSENLFAVSGLGSLTHIAEDVAVATCRAAKNRLNGCVMDLVFLIDHSWAIATYGETHYRMAENWNLILNFFQLLVQSLDVGPSAIRVACYTFGRNISQLHFDLYEGQTKDQVLADIGNIRHKADSYGRNPAIVLRTVKTRISSKDFGDRPNMHKVIVLLSGAVYAKDMKDVKSEVDSLKAGGEASIIWIGVSNFINAPEMRKVVTAPPSENFFEVSRLHMLSQKVDDVAGAICKAARNSLNDCIMDLVFLIDHSIHIASGANGYYSREEWRLVLDFFQSLVLTHDVGPSSTHVAAGLFGRGARIQFNLNQGQTKDSVLAAISEIENSRESSADLESGLLEIKRTIFNEANGDRPETPNVLIVIAAALSSDRIESITLAANSLKNTGTSIIFIGVSKSIDEAFEGAIATEPLSNNIFKLSSVDNLHTIVDGVSKQSCREVREQIADKRNSAWFG